MRFIRSFFILCPIRLQTHSDLHLKKKHGDNNGRQVLLSIRGTIVDKRKPFFLIELMWTFSFLKISSTQPESAPLILLCLGRHF